MGTPTDSYRTRSAIIEAAGQLFAEKGFTGVTVREITNKAEANLSALNYHFGTKEGLYHEVLLDACKANSLTQQQREQLLAIEPVKALYILVDEVLKEYRKQGASNWRMVIITRESRTPSFAFDDVVKEYFIPESNFIAEIIGRAVHKPPTDEQVRFAVVTMIALTETFGLYDTLIGAIAPELDICSNRNELSVRKIVHLILEAAGQAD